MSNGSNTFDVFGLIGQDAKAHEILIKWDSWKNARIPWEEQVKELRDYLYAVDTSTTANLSNPFANRTTVPKLTQIAQNIHANYFEHMFSNEDWISWEAHNREAALNDKRKSIESYMRTKSRQQQLPQVLSDLIWDWIIYGNCFAELCYTKDKKKDPITGEEIPGYVGPRLQRISPHDIVFNPTAASFKSSPKIIRRLYSVGEIQKMAMNRPDLPYTTDLVKKITGMRDAVRDNSKLISNAEMDKTQGLCADGFSNIIEYYNSDLVEVMQFYGDYYDGDKEELLENHVITIVDRAWVIDERPIDSWSGTDYLYHNGWASRPDNLYGMGPLDNLVGMQYKIDKLENMRADVFDQIAHPTTVEVGTVEFFGTRGAPGGRFVVEEGGQVQYLQPDGTALQADLQIQQTMQDMEQLAGAPREAMGMRSPGEKTFGEVQLLDNAANRLFRHKVVQFETQFIEPILNDMLEMSRRMLDGADVVRAKDSVFGIDEFMSITKEDLTATGKLYPKGSSAFVANANMLQNLQVIFNSPVAQYIAPHLSKVQLAKAVEDLLGVEEFSIVQENIGVLEEMQTQRVAQTAQQQLQEEQATDPREVVDEQAQAAEAEATGAPF